MTWLHERVPLALSALYIPPTDGFAALGATAQRSIALAEIPSPFTQSGSAAISTTFREAGMPLL